MRKNTKIREKNQKIENNITRGYIYHQVFQIVIVNAMLHLQIVLLKNDASPYKAKQAARAIDTEKSLIPALYRQVIVIFLHISGTLVLAYFFQTFFRLYTLVFALLRIERILAGFFLARLSHDCLSMN